MNLSNHSKAIFAVLAAQTIWGIAGPLVKITLNNVPPFGLMFFRFLLVTLLLFPIYEFRLRFQEKPKSRQDLWNIFLVGFFAVFANIAFYFVGQRLTTVIDAWVITSTGTPFVILLSYLFFKERLQPLVYFGAILAFLGTLVVIGAPILTFGSGSFLGNILMLGSTLAGAIPFFLIKRLVAREFHPLTLTYYFFLIGLILSLPLFVWEYLQNPTWLLTIQPKSLLTISYLALGSSIGAYSLQNFGLKFLSPSITATLGYTSAIVAIGLSIIFLHELLTSFFILGTTLVIIGLFLAETRHPSHPIHKFRHQNPKAV